MFLECVATTILPTTQHLFPLFHALAPLNHSYHCYILHTPWRARADVNKAFHTRRPHSISPQQNQDPLVFTPSPVPAFLFNLFNPFSTTTSRRKSVGFQKWFPYMYGRGTRTGDRARTVMDYSLSSTENGSPGSVSSQTTPPQLSEKENADPHNNRSRIRRPKFYASQSMSSRSIISPQLRSRSKSLSDDEFPLSPLNRRHDRQSKGVNHLRAGSNESGILQEIGNSAQRPGLSSRSLSCQLTSDTALSHDGEAPTILAERRLRSRRSEGGLRKVSRPRRLSGPSSRKTSEGSAKYIEQLECQVVSLQTQLQSFTSPAAIHSQATKLRTITAENRALQQEVAAWEQNFNERMGEQTQQHALIANSLKAQIKNLENERRRGQELQQELALELEQKHKEIEGLEEAKVNLERRLDFMGDIMAKSPGSLNLYSEPTASAQAKKRPSSYAPPRSGDRNNDPIFRRWPSIREGALSPTRTGPLYHRWRPSIDTSSVSGQTEPESDHSETTLVDQYDWHGHGRRGSTVLQRSSTDLGQRAPNRRMRKFHSGSTGPRSLILAPSSPAQDSPLSPPLSSVSAPGVSAFDLAESQPRSTTVHDQLPDGSSQQAFANESLLCSMDEVLQSESASVSAVTLPTRSTLLDAPHSKRDSHVPSSDESLDPVKERPETPLNGVGSGDCETIKAPSPGTPTPQPAVRTQDDSENSKTPTGPKRHARQSSLVTRILTRLSGNVDSYSNPARQVFENTWQTARPILLRPVVEFRWWLVQILLGDLSRKRTIWLRRNLLTDRPGIPPRLQLSGLSGAERAIGLGLTIPEPPPYLPPPNNETNEITHASDTARHYQQSNESVPQAPPVTWLKFSMTLVIAVGIAIKDGPSSLFANP